MTNQRKKCQANIKDNAFDNFLKGYACYLLFCSQLDFFLFLNIKLAATISLDNGIFLP